MKIEKGMKFRKDGIRIDVHDVKDGEVYFRRWPKGVQDQLFFEGLRRMSLDDFIASVDRGAKDE